MKTHHIKEERCSIIPKRDDGHYVFAAKIFMQYRVEIAGKSNKMRPCSITTVVITSRTAKEALRLAKKRGKAGETHYLNSDGNSVFVEFVGIVDMIDITFISQFHEVWVWFGEKLKPLERCKQILPSEEDILNRIAKRNI